MSDQALSWKTQLTRVRDVVVEQEKRRETEKRLERERNEAALTKRLKEDTPEALTARFNDIRHTFDRDARKFYPLPQLEAVLQQIADLTDLLKFYDDCVKSFPRIFTPQLKSTFTQLLSELAELQRGLDRQLGQWREVKPLVDSVVFRPRQPADDASLVATAKSFSDRAHKVPLSIPGDFFAREHDNFWVVDVGGAAMGYIKSMAADKVLTFAFDPGDKANFNKFVRGVLYKFATQGPLPEKLTAIRVRIAFVREVKFFTDMGFVRAETKGPTDWIYQREVG